MYPNCISRLSIEKWLWWWTSSINMRESIVILFPLLSVSIPLFLSFSFAVYINLFMLKKSALDFENIETSPFCQKTKPETRSCPAKKLFWKRFKNSQENFSAWVSIWQPVCNFIKEWLLCKWFSVSFEKLSNRSVCKNLFNLFI